MDIGQISGDAIAEITFDVKPGGGKVPSLVLDNADVLVRAVGVTHYVRNILTHEDAVSCLLVQVEGQGEFVEQGEVDTDIEVSGLLPGKVLGRVFRNRVCRCRFSAEDSVRSRVDVKGCSVSADTLLVTEVTIGDTELTVVQPAVSPIHEAFL